MRGSRIWKQETHFAGTQHADDAYEVATDIRVPPNQPAPPEMARPAMYAAPMAAASSSVAMYDGDDATFTLEGLRLAGLPDN